MSGINLPGVDSGISVEDLANLVAKLIKEVQWLTDGNISANNIKANTITAKKMDVDQLSAIAADLGTITAGIIYGAYIATSNGTYPRIEFSSVNRLLTAFNTATQYVSISPSTGGTPGITWNDGSLVAAISAAASVGILLTAFGGNKITLQASTINLNPSSILNLYGAVKINDVSTFTGSFSNGTQTIVVNQGLITSVF